MSHISQLHYKLTDSMLPAFAAACAELGLEFRQGTTFRWYGRFMNDSPVPEGMKPEEYGTCEYVISHPSWGYDVGLWRHPDGTFRLVYDEWGANGRAIVQAIGANGATLMDSVNFHADLQQAQRLRRRTEVRHTEAGRRQLVVYSD